MILQFSQMRLTLERTFIWHLAAAQIANRHCRKRPWHAQGEHYCTAAVKGDKKRRRRLRDRARGGILETRNREARFAAALCDGSPSTLKA
jgi:hypothetical protein